MKKLAVVASLGLLFANVVFAAPYTLQFTSTVTTNGTLPAGVTIGDSFDIYVVVDNGGVTGISQTWGFTDIQSVTYSINSGSYIASFPSTTFTNPSTSGDIQTDGAGLIASSTANWRADSTPGNMDSGGLELSEWFINGANDMIFYAPCCDPSVGAAGSTDSAAAWTVTPGVIGPVPVAPATVPTMSAYGLVLTAMGLLIVAGRRFRARRQA